MYAHPFLWSDCAECLKSCKHWADIRGMDSFTMTLIRTASAEVRPQPRLVKPTAAPSAFVRVSTLDVRVGARVTDHLTVNYPALREALRQESPSAKPLPGDFGKELQRILDELKARLTNGESPLDAVEAVASTYTAAPARGADDARAPLNGKRAAQPAAQPGGQPSRSHLRLTK